MALIDTVRSEMMAAMKEKNTIKKTVILQETGEKQIPPTIVDINVTAYIPDEWVGSKEQKMIFF